MITPVYRRIITVGLLLLVLLSWKGAQNEANVRRDVYIAAHERADASNRPMDIWATTDGFQWKNEPVGTFKPPFYSNWAKIETIYPGKQLSWYDRNFVPYSPDTPTGAFLRKHFPH